MISFFLNIIKAKYRLSIICVHELLLPAFLYAVIGIINHVLISPFFLFITSKSHSLLLILGYFRILPNAPIVLLSINDNT